MGRGGGLLVGKGEGYGLEKGRIIGGKRGRDKGRVKGGKRRGLW